MHVFLHKNRLSSVQSLQIRLKFAYGLESFVCYNPIRGIEYETIDHKASKDAFKFYRFYIGIIFIKATTNNQYRVFWFMIAYGVYVIYDAIQIQKSIKTNQTKKRESSRFYFIKALCYLA